MAQSLLRRASSKVFACLVLIVALAPAYDCAGAEPEDPATEPRGATAAPRGEGLDEQTALPGTTEQVKAPKWLRFPVEYDELKLRRVAVARADATALRERMGKRFSKREVSFYEALSNGRVAGYAYRSSERGKHGRIHYVVYLDLEGTVLSVEVVSSREVRGRAVARESFLAQYRGKSAADPVAVGRDINAISGATISSKALTRGVREAVVVWNYVYTNGAPAYNAAPLSLRFQRQAKPTRRALPSA